MAFETVFNSKMILTFSYARKPQCSIFDENFKFKLVICILTASHKKYPTSKFHSQCNMFKNNSKCHSFVLLFWPPAFIRKMESTQCSIAVKEGSVDFVSLKKILE